MASFQTFLEAGVGHVGLAVVDVYLEVGVRPFQEEVAFPLAYLEVEHHLAASFEN